MELLFNLVKGIPVTLIVTLGAFALGLVVAVPIAIMRQSGSFLIRNLARIYLDVVRGIPPIVWLFIIFFGVGSGIIMLSSMQAAIIGMGMVSSAYIAEIYRGGYLSIPAGQGEATDVLGMTFADKLRYVIAPQVLRVSVPPIATYFVSLLKDTTVASTIGVNDVLMRSLQQAQSGIGGFTPFLIAAAIYIVLSIPVGLFARRMDERMRQMSQA